MYNSKFLLDLPYPSLDSVKPNSYDCSLVIQDYAGYISEFSAISQYFYHHLYAQKDGYDEIAETLMGIGTAEMHHLNILGELILKLGGDPKLLAPTDCSRTSWWCGDNVDYSKKIAKILSQDIKGEEAAIKSYTAHAEMVNQQAVAECLRRISLDEELHLKILIHILGNLPMEIQTSI